MCWWYVFWLSWLTILFSVNPFSLRWWYCWPIRYIVLCWLSAVMHLSCLRLLLSATVIWPRGWRIGGTEMTWLTYLVSGSDVPMSRRAVFIRLMTLHYPTAAAMLSSADWAGCSGRGLTTAVASATVFDYVTFLLDRVMTSLTGCCTVMTTFVPFGILFGHSVLMLFIRYLVILRYSDTVTEVVHILFGIVLPDTGILIRGIVVPMTLIYSR